MGAIGGAILHLIVGLIGDLFKRDDKKDDSTDRK